MRGTPSAGPRFIMPASMGIWMLSGLMILTQALLQDARVDVKAATNEGKMPIGYCF
jgi:hypothetical protein